MSNQSCPGSGLDVTFPLHADHPDTNLQQGSEEEIHIYYQNLGKKKRISTKLIFGTVSQHGTYSYGEYLNLPELANPKEIEESVIPKEGGLDYMGTLIFWFSSEWSKLGQLLQTDDNEAEMKKKFKIFDSAPSYGTLF